MKSAKTLSTTAPLKKKRKFFSADDFELTALTLPTVIVILLFSYLPMFGILIAFKNFQLDTGNFIIDLINSPWSGFENFKYLFATNDAWLIIRNTVGYNVVFIALNLILPITFAIILSQLRNKNGAKAYQTMMLFPNFISWIVVGGFVYSFLAPTHGLLVGLSTMLGTEPIDWYSTASAWPFIIVLLNVWKSVGYSTIVYLASISGIDQTLYEAAMMDGATKWQQAKYITIPSIKTIAVILLILAVGSIFAGDIGLFYIIPRNSGALYDVTTIIDVYVYNALAGSGNIGMSSAAAFFQSTVGCLLVVGTNLVVRKIDRESSLF